MSSAEDKPQGLIDPKLFQLMVDQAKDYALFVLDPAGRIMSWNTGAQRIKGYAPEEIIGRHFSVFYTRESVESGWPDHEIKAATAEGRFEDEGWRVRKDGSRFWANVVITALRDENGKLLGFSKITRDLTDRKMHEEALRQSEERFRLMIEGVADYAIYMLDPEGVVSSWNLGAQRMKGYSREEIIGRHFSRFFREEDVQGGAPWEELATARREGRVQTEGWRVRKNGERFWARVVVSALYDSDGHLRGFAKVTQDLTDRRHMQDLERATRNVSEFIATLAHELRNPLAPIRTALDVMGKMPPGDPGIESMRQTIDRQTRQLSRIVEDMLDISRVASGSLSMQEAPLDMAEVVRRAVETAAPAIEAGRHHLDVDLPAEKVGVRGDTARLIQLLANLLNNAARYTPDPGSISVKLREEGGSAVVRVRDTGRGIEEQALPKIFDMFVRGGTPSERAQAGLGIGLALSRRIAELHGGTLAVFSEGENKGAEFTLRLPLAPSAARGAPQPANRQPPQPPAAMPRRRVLIVDDNVDAATTLELLLRSLGHETSVAHNGTEALRLADEFRPEVVLLDIGMPGIDGYEVARRLRTMKHDQLRIVAVTGWGQEADRQRSKEAGFDLHLVKPVEPDELAKALRHGATLH